MRDDGLRTQRKFGRDLGNCLSCYQPLQNLKLTCRQYGVGHGVEFGRIEDSALTSCGSMNRPPRDSLRMAAMSTSGSLFSVRCPRSTGTKRSRYGLWVVMDAQNKHRQRRIFVKNCSNEIRLPVRVWSYPLVRRPKKQAQKMHYLDALHCLRNDMDVRRRLQDFFDATPRTMVWSSEIGVRIM